MGKGPADGGSCGSEMPLVPDPPYEKKT